MGLGIALALVATLGWGIGDVMARKAMVHAPAGTVLIIASALVLLALGALGVASDGTAAFTDLPPRFFGFVVLMGFLGYVTGQLFYFMGMKRAGLKRAAPIIGLTPLIAVGFAVAIGGERPSLPTVVAAVVIVSGVIVILTDRETVTR